jgi:hypothetical protein
MAENKFPQTLKPDSFPADSTAQPKPRPTPMNVFPQMIYTTVVSLPVPEGANRPAPEDAPIRSRWKN